MFTTLGKKALSSPGKLKSRQVKPAAYKKMLRSQMVAKPETVALLGAAQAQEQVDDSVNSGAIIGTSLAVFGAAAAIYAIRRNMKKDNDFERQ